MLFKVFKRRDKTFWRRPKNMHQPANTLSKMATFPSYLGCGKSLLLQKLSYVEWQPG